MQHADKYGLIADSVLVLHFAVVAFVVGGLMLIVAGNRYGWTWVNRLCFRALHLTAIATVAAQSWLGITCPLTDLESWLRTGAGGSGYDRSFIEYWLQRAIFFEAPTWLFTLSYTLFGALVLLAWWKYPPARKLRGQGPRGPGR